MANLLKQRQSQVRPKVLKAGLVPSAVERKQSAPAQIRFSNGTSAEASCLRCVDAPCLTYASDEPMPVGLADFPSDKSLDVCPTDAISRSATGAAFVMSERCIYCGICALRCPAGVISLYPGKGAVVADEPNAAFVEKGNAQAIDAATLRKLFPREISVGEILRETAHIVDLAASTLELACSIDDDLPNRLVRNLLRAVGAKATMRRRGDNAARIDILFQIGPKRGVGEVEFGTMAILEAPRAILDDVAVVVGRHGWDRHETAAVIVTDILPNRRSDYWRILRDINAILNLQVATITIFALELLVWSRQTLTLDHLALFAVDESLSSYRKQVLDVLLGRPANTGTNPRPFVDLVK